MNYYFFFTSLLYIGGYIVDKFGHRICMILFASLITIGQVVFALGLSIKSWELMFVGRIIYGFGGESLGVANSAILADWFKGTHLFFLSTNCLMPNFWDFFRQGVGVCFRVKSEYCATRVGHQQRCFPNPRKWCFLAGYNIIS